jgi:hypothetical protein
MCQIPCEIHGASHTLELPIVTGDKCNLCEMCEMCEMKYIKYLYVLN